MKRTLKEIGIRNVAYLVDEYLRTKANAIDELIAVDIEVNASKICAIRFSRDWKTMTDSLISSFFTGLKIPKTTWI